MIGLTTGALALLLAGAGVSPCAGPVRTHLHVQWSTPATMVAPDRSWVVEVHPLLDAASNQTPIMLRRCDDSQQWPLFTLERSADLHWSADSKQLLIVDQPLSGTNKLLLLSIPAIATGRSDSSVDALDRMVTVSLKERLGTGALMQFYLPAVVSWTDSTLLLAVGGETYVGTGGELGRFCYGVRVRTDTLHLDDVLSEAELRTRSGHGCQVSP